MISFPTVYVDLLQCGIISVFRLIWLSILIFPWYTVDPLSLIMKFTCIALVEQDALDAKVFSYKILL